MLRVVAQVLIACALTVVLGACSTFGSYVGLGTNEKGWTKDGCPLGSSLAWSGRGASLLVAAEIVPCEFPFTVRVKNLSGAELRVLVERTAESPETDARLGVWRIEGSADPARPLERGTEVVLGATSSGGAPATAALTLRADRPWTMEEFVREGDTISYDLVLRRAGAETVCPLRFEVVHVGSDFHWWTPLALVAAGAIVWVAPELALRAFLTAH